MPRFTCCLSSIVLVAVMLSPCVAEESSFVMVDQAARQAASRPYRSSPSLPASIRAWDYDDYRLVAFDGAHDVWKENDGPFRLQFFHRGYLYQDEVRVHLLDGRRQETVRFDRRLFQYRGRIADVNLPDDLGFAGVRVLGKFVGAENFQEIITFLGASYFRALGAGQVYGTSARGLAIDVGLPQPEEFPAFREFWIARSPAGTNRLTMWALLDGPSVAGAYQFDWQPGETTRCDVRAKLYFRRKVTKVGYAPMTSMWAWGDGLPGPTNDSRPKVHDADGLLIATSDNQWIWRPFSRQTYPSVSRYDMADVRGFGLLQRDRDPHHYRDDEAKYDRRPSVWIEPGEKWSQGAVELLELPGEHEGVDNIAAWWTPQPVPGPEHVHELTYSVAFRCDEPPHPLARAITFRLDRRNDSIHVEVDFLGKFIAKDGGNVPLNPQVRAVRGSVENVHGEITIEGTYRLAFEVRPESDQAVEIVADVRRNHKVVSETWRYLCRP